MCPPYTEAATAPGAWSHTLTAPTTFPHLRGVLMRHARRTGVPVAAFVHDHGEERERVRAITLYRDPSKTHGTPSIQDCAASVSELADATGWADDPVQLPAGGITVGLGLRRGYDAYAPVHDHTHAVVMLHWHGGGWRTSPARIVSARYLPDTNRVRWADEPGLIVYASRDVLPAIATVARELGQHRFTVTDHQIGATYALELATLADRKDTAE